MSLSQHTIPAKNSKHRCTVGWDKGMSTFYAVVVDTDLEAQAARETRRCVEPVVCWIGADRVGEVEEVEALAARLEEYATIPADVLEQLRRDKAAAEPPSDAQRAAQQLIERGRAAR